jgi:uncharacterized glyoxalase superfamily protein PhnB
MTSVWPCISYTDAPAAIEFLQKAFGFDAALVVPGEADGVVVHAELRLPGGGGIMLGSAGAGEEPFASVPTGAANIYVVVDEPDALHDRAVIHGAEIVRGLRDEDYGSRGFTARDPEGNLWSFGTYAGT